MRVVLNISSSHYMCRKGCVGHASVHTCSGPVLGCPEVARCVEQQQQAILFHVSCQARTQVFIRSFAGPPLALRRAYVRAFIDARVPATQSDAERARARRAQG